MISWRHNCKSFALFKLFSNFTLYLSVELDCSNKVNSYCNEVVIVFTVKNGITKLNELIDQQKD